MPEMGGGVFAEKVMRLLPATKILCMSGHSEDAIAHHGTLDPGARFIAKPFSVIDLRRKVREVLDEN